MSVTLHDATDAGQHVLGRIEAGQEAFNPISFKKSLHNMSFRFISGIENRD